ncbi:MAG: hypothetical protein V1859_00940 [archaeon]
MQNKTETFVKLRNTIIFFVLIGAFILGFLNKFGTVSLIVGSFVLFVLAVFLFYFAFKFDKRIRKDSNKELFSEIVKKEGRCLVNYIFLFFIGIIVYGILPITTEQHLIVGVSTMSLIEITLLTLSFGYITKLNK